MAEGACLLYGHAAVLISVYVFNRLFPGREEKTLRIGNAFAFFALVLSVLWLPVMDLADSPISLVYGRFQLCMAVLAGYIIVASVMGILRKCRRKDDRAEVHAIG